MVPEIEIVQMKYGNQLSFGTVYNFDEEYRPKLFKRLREFVWEEAIHETIRTFPVVYDSDIVITHLPTSPESYIDNPPPNSTHACAHLDTKVQMIRHLHRLYYD